MTQRQKEIIEAYLFDVFVKLEGNGEKSENWWNNVFLLEAITTMGVRDYKISNFCGPSEFFTNDEEAKDDNKEETKEKGESDTESETDDDETDDDSTDERKYEAVDNYLENYYQHDDYYWTLLDLAATNANAGGNGERLLQQQYLYVYTIENSDYFMNKFIYGDVVMLK
jgi:hypothetical protein